MNHFAVLLLVKVSKACSASGNNAPEGYLRRASEALVATACWGERSMMYTADVICGRKSAVNPKKERQHHGGYLTVMANSPLPMM